MDIANKTSLATPSIKTLATHASTRAWKKIWWQEPSLSEQEESNDDDDASSSSEDEYESVVHAHDNKIVKHVGILWRIRYR